MRITLAFAVALDEVGEGPCDEADAIQGQHFVQRMRRVGHMYEPASSSSCEDELCLVLEPSEGNSPEARRRSTNPLSRSSSCDVLLGWVLEWPWSPRPD